MIDSEVSTKSFSAIYMHNHQLSSTIMIMETYVYQQVQRWDPSSDQGWRTAPSYYLTGSSNK